MREYSAAAKRQYIRLKERRNVPLKGKFSRGVILCNGVGYVVECEEAVRVVVGDGAAN